MTFATPDGWLDVSPGAPPENLAAVPEAVRVGATSDLLHAHYAVARNLEASMVVVYMPDDESGAIDEAYLDHFVSTRMFEKRMRLARAISKKEVVSIGELSWGRLEGTTVDNYRFLAFVVPGHPQNAWIQFTAVPEAYDRLVGTFDATARATRGARAPAARKKNDAPVPLLFVAVAALGALTVMKWKRGSTKSSL